MAGPYDYSINIPQPPANNFLQSLTGIMQLRQMQEQSAIQQQQAQFAQQMQPLQMQQIEEQMKASRAQQGLIGVQTQGAKLAVEERQLSFDQQKQVRSAIKAFNDNPDTGIVELAKVAPYMDDNARAGIAKSVPFYIGQQIDKALASDQEITPEQYQKWSNALTLLPTNEQQQARSAILSMPQNLQAFTKSGVIGITNASLNGDREAAMFASDEAAKALYNSNHPAARVTAGLFDKLTNQLKDESVDLRKVPVSALNVATLIQDKAFQGALIDTLKESEAIQKASTEKPLPSTVLKQIEKLENTAKGFDSSAKELTDAADALTQLSGGKPESGWWNEKFTKIKNAIQQGQEVPIRNELQRVLNLGGLGAEAQAQGGAVRSNVMVSLATKYIPDVWKNPDAAIEKAKINAEVKRRFAQVNRAEAEWDSQFRSLQNAKQDSEIYGVQISKGQSKSSFINAVTEKLFPKDEVVNTPALNSFIGTKNTQPAPRKGKQTAPKLGQKVPGTNATFEPLPE
jgi:hypothetical protein